MKYFALLLAAFCLLTSSCKKDIETTGTLEIIMSFSDPDHKNLYVFAAENENYPILDIPQGNQKIILNVGNYLIAWKENPSWLGSEVSAFQIRAGETTRVYR